MWIMTQVLLAVACVVLYLLRRRAERSIAVPVENRLRVSCGLIRRKVRNFFVYHADYATVPAGSGALDKSRFSSARVARRRRCSCV